MCDRLWRKAQQFSGFREPPRSTDIVLVLLQPVPIGALADESFHLLRSLATLLARCQLTLDSPKSFCLHPCLLWPSLHLLCSRCYFLHRWSSGRTLCHVHLKWVVENVGLDQQLWLWSYDDFFAMCMEVFGDFLECKVGMTNQSPVRLQRPCWPVCPYPNWCRSLSRWQTASSQSQWL